MFSFFCEVDVFAAEKPPVPALFLVFEEGVAVHPVQQMSKNIKKILTGAVCLSIYVPFLHSILIHLSLQAQRLLIIVTNRWVIKEKCDKRIVPAWLNKTERY